MAPQTKKYFLVDWPENQAQDRWVLIIYDFAKGTADVPLLGLSFTDLPGNPSLFQACEAIRGALKLKSGAAAVTTGYMYQEKPSRGVELETAAVAAPEVKDDWFPEQDLL